MKHAQDNTLSHNFDQLNIINQQNIFKQTARKTTCQNIYFFTVRDITCEFKISLIFHFKRRDKNQRYFYFYSITLYFYNIDERKLTFKMLPCIVKLFLYSGYKKMKYVHKPSFIGCICVVFDIYLIEMCSFYNYLYYNQF